MSAIIHQFPQDALKSQEKYRCCSESDRPEILADIYREDTNIIIWKRRLSNHLQYSINQFIKTHRDFRLVQVVTLESVFDILHESLCDAQCRIELSENIAELVEMFCVLFDRKTVGLRLTMLDRAMCPKFHFDRLPCRLVTTYHGPATEWLPQDSVDRTKLAASGHGMTDHESGLYKNEHAIQKLEAGDVALLKGELWQGNEDAGVIHRSPQVVKAENRLLLTLDFVN